MSVISQIVEVLEDRKKVETANEVDVAFFKDLNGLSYANLGCFVAFSYSTLSTDSRIFYVYATAEGELVLQGLSNSYSVGRDGKEQAFYDYLAVTYPDGDAYFYSQEELQEAAPLYSFSNPQQDFLAFLTYGVTREKFYNALVSYKNIFYISDDHFSVLSEQILNQIARYIDSTLTDLRSLLAQANTFDSYTKELIRKFISTGTYYVGDTKLAVIITGYDSCIADDGTNGMGICEVDKTRYPYSPSEVYTVPAKGLAFNPSKGTYLITTVAPETWIVGKAGSFYFE